jgi:hypothetical protein
LEKNQGFSLFSAKKVNYTDPSLLAKFEVASNGETLKGLPFENTFAIPEETSRAWKDRIEPNPQNIPAWREGHYLDRPVSAQGHAS